MLIKVKRNQMNKLNKISILINKFIVPNITQQLFGNLKTFFIFDAVSKIENYLKS